MAFNLEYYKGKLANLEERRNALMRAGNYKASMRLNQDIEEVRRLINESEPKPVTELFTHEQIRESGLVPAVLEVHLAADYLAACCYTVEDIVKQLGGVAVTVIPELKEILSRANKFCEFLYTKGEDLESLIENNESLLEALHKKTMSYIKQRVCQKPKRQQ